MHRRGVNQRLLRVLLAYPQRLLLLRPVARLYPRHVRQDALLAVHIRLELLYPYAIEFTLSPRRDGKLGSERTSSVGGCARVYVSQDDHWTCRARKRLGSVAG